MNLVKYNEKLLIWMHRENKTVIWLSEQLNQTRQTVASKIKDNTFNSLDKSIIKSLGFKD